MDSDGNLNFFRRSHRSIPNFHLGTVCASLVPVLKKDIYLFVEILKLENAKSSVATSPIFLLEVTSRTSIKTLFIKR